MRWRLTVTEAQGEVMRSRLVHTSGSCGVGVLVHCALHLLENLIDLDQVILGADIGHGRESVMLLVGSVTAMTVDRDNRRCREVLCWERSRVNGECTVQRHQSLADLRIRGRIKLAALGLTEEIVQGVISALAVVKLGSSSMVAHMIAPTATKRLVVHRAAKGRPVVLIITASMTIRGVGRLTKGSRVSTNLAIVIIIARRS